MPHGHQREEYRFEARFGKIIAAVGIAAIPRALFYYMGELGLSYADVGFIGHILSFRWTSDVPFPGVEKLAHQAGCRASTIQRRRQALEELEYCALVPRFKDGRQTSNGYDLTALLERLEQCIRRDWQTVWKDRDPMVGEDEPDDPFARSDDAMYPQTVDKTLLDRGNATATGRKNAAPTGRNLAIRQDSTSATRRAAAARPHEEKQLQEPMTAMKQTETKTTKKNAAVPATDIRMHTSIDHGSDGGAPASHAVLDRAIDRYSVALNDAPRSRAGNRTRARRLWEASELSEQAFLDILATAYERTLHARSQPGHSPETGAADKRGDSRMPYFFAVVEDQLDAVAGDNLSRLWRQTLRHLRGSLRPELVRSWLRDAAIVTLRDNPEALVAELTLRIPDPDGRAKLGAEYQPMLERALATAVGHPVAIVAILP